MYGSTTARRPDGWLSITRSIRDNDSRAFSTKGDQKQIARHNGITSSLEERNGANSSAVNRRPITLSAEKFFPTWVGRYRIPNGSYLAFGRTANSAAVICLT